MREAIRTSDDERLEGILRVEARVTVTPGSQSLAVSVRIAILVRRLDIGRFGPCAPGLGSVLTAEVLLAVRLLTREAFVSVRRLGAVTVLAVALVSVVLVIARV